MTNEKLDCGHLPTPLVAPGAGYGKTVDGKRHCYVCCTVQDLYRLREGLPLTLYVSDRAARRSFGIKEYPFLINWPGAPLMHCQRVYIEDRRGVPFKLHVSAVDAFGMWWWGVGAGQHGTYVRMRRYAGTTRSVKVSALKDRTAPLTSAIPEDFGVGRQILFTAIDRLPDEPPKEE